MGQLLTICKKCIEQFTYPASKDTLYVSKTWHTCKAGHYIGEVTVKTDKECSDFKGK